MATGDYWIGQSVLKSRTWPWIGVAKVSACGLVVNEAMWEAIGVRSWSDLTNHASAIDIHSDEVWSWLQRSTMVRSVCFDSKIIWQLKSSKVMGSFPRSPMMMVAVAKRSSEMIMPHSMQRESP